ncbi:MAG TPA: response regulator [Kouleothrix sp.]|uniref:response regulator n=1 Tax=Kouleothrix sp. TaxID=2779161 RepID=UPI002C43956D|nr:response regulator [Kouleothrix sp.]HRC74502.1 response regulator [Kouleothrix sp.]
MRPSHILIVDNDPAAAMVTQHGLQRLFVSDAEVEIAASPLQAWARCQDTPVDLVVVDPSTENSPANALVKDLHAFYPEIPVVVLTAYDTPRLRSQMRSLGVRHYLAKPVELQDLGISARVALSEHLASAGNV